MTRVSLLHSDHDLYLVTGPSGAGRSTAIYAMEDLGYEVIDNLPLSLVPKLVEGAPLGRPIALGLDVRNRDFNATALVELIDELTRNPSVSLKVIYLDCVQSELLRRFSETRRRHPLARDTTPAQAIEHEMDLLVAIKVRADITIDTSEMNPHDLRAEMSNLFAPKGKQALLEVSVQSFSYKRGVPRGLDMIFDCRFLQNPHWDTQLRDKDGRDEQVAAYVVADANYPLFFQKLFDFLQFMLPAQLDEGKTHVSIGFGCTGGQHRSVAIVEIFGNALAQQDWQVSKRHLELERNSALGRLQGLGDPK
jgi:UPF0042 nucleotide-binding protein